MKIIGGLSRPSKMPGWAYGLPAKECKTGSKLAKIKGSVCYDCYALKGMYRFKPVQQAQYRRLEATKTTGWVDAMAMVINSKKSKYFRWHDSGDVQDVQHLMKIFEVCELTPTVQHWMPTREAWVKKYLKDRPKNLVIRFSGTMMDQLAPESWPNSSSVITKDQPWFGATSILCPSSKQGNKCLNCRQCWNPDIKNISYKAH